MEGDSYGVQIWIKIISTDSLLYPSKKSKVGGYFAPLIGLYRFIKTRPNKNIENIANSHKSVCMLYVPLRTSALEISQRTCSTDY